MKHLLHLLKKYLCEQKNNVLEKIQKEYIHYNVRYGNTH